MPLTDRVSTILNIPVVWIPSPASNYNAGHGPYELIVIHDIEGSAQSGIDTLSNPNRQASTHFITDPGRNRIVQMVGLYSTAWTAGSNKGNDNGINIENPGFAGKPFDPLVVSYCGKIAGYIAAHTGIPIRHLSRAEANAPGVKGICGHGDLDQHKPQSEWHWDPGPTWPWDTMLSIAEQTRQLVQAGGDPGPFFPETGFGVRGGILADFTLRGGVPIIGYPRSWEYDTRENGVKIRRQWFQRACAEWIPNRPDQPDVTWTLLGDAIIDNWFVLGEWQFTRTTHSAFEPGRGWNDEPKHLTSA
jgi:N-acetylmuramoyl-L-alanine amidase